MSVVSTAIVFDKINEPPLTLPGDDEIDMEFFDGLFEDLPSENLDNLFATTASTSIPVEGKKASSPSPPLRRQRRLAAEINRFWPETEMLGEWRRIAKRQQKERAKSEKENAELREVVATHSKFNRKICKLLKQASMVASSQAAVDPAVPLAIPYFGPTPQLSQITLELDQLASSADHILSRRTSVSPKADLLSVESHQVNVGSASMDVTWVLPFDAAMITKTLLVRSIGLVTKTNFLDAKTVYDTSDLNLVQAVTRTKQKKNRLVSKHGYVVTRREPPRSDGSNLLVMMARVGFVSDAKLAVLVEGDIFIHVSKVPGHDEAKLGPLSRVHWYMHRRSQAQPTGSTLMAPEDQADRVQQQSTQKAQREVDKLTVAMETLLLSPV